MSTPDTGAMRPLPQLLFPDDLQFWYETLRWLGLAAYGGADFGEVVSTAARISAGLYDSWHAQWAATAQRVEAEVCGQLAAGHQVSGRDGLLRAATCWRSAEFFTRDAGPDPRGSGPARRGRSWPPAWPATCAAGSPRRSPARCSPAAA